MGLLLALTVALTGCAWAGSGAELDGTWTLESGMGSGDPIAPIAGSPITLTVEGSDIGGTAACNQYGGTLERTGDEVVIGALSMTEMACDEPIMALESAYLGALAAVNHVARVGDRLMLTGPDVQLDFTLVPPVADAPLSGTAWSLDSIVNGDAVASVMGDGSIAFEEDGTVSGSTGCRGFGGRYELTGSTLHVGRLVTDDRACTDELADQDAEVLEVLQSAPTVSIEGLRLSLRTGESGLDYLAGS